MKLEFKRYLQTIINQQGNHFTESVIDSFLKDLSELIPKKLQEVDGTEYQSVFETTDLYVLSRIKARLNSGGDLYEFNMSLGNGRPSQAIYRYIDFLNTRDNSLEVAISRENLLQAIKEFEDSDFTHRSKNRYFTIDESIYILPVKHIVSEAFRKVGLNKSLTTNTAQPYLENFFSSFKGIDINYENAVLPLYQDIALKLISYRDSRGDLIDLLNDMKEERLMTVSLEDESSYGKQKLKDIDPFTFYSNFNRNLKPKNRANILKYLKDDWELEGKIPTFDPRIPWMQNQSAWFFTFEKDRQDNDIEMLWKLFIEILNDNVQEATFNRCLQIKKVDNNLSFGLFWINSNKYISLDASTKEYLQGRLDNYNGQSLSELKFDGYFKLLAMIQEEIQEEDFYQIVSNKNRVVTPINDNDLINNHRELFIEIAQIHHLQHQKGSDAKYFQIYPNNIPKEGNGGTHYEFIAENGSLYLDIHIESKAIVDIQLLRKTIKETVIKNGYTFHTSVRPLRINFTDFLDEEITQNFNRVFEIFEPIIEYAYNKVKPKETVMKLNTILYGPPGTGKTYSTTTQALEIIDNKIYKNDAEAKKRFTELQNSGQIQMVTFHQSYGYEEFVEGLKAKSDDGTVSYGVEDGVFKKIATEAKINYDNYMSDETIKVDTKKLMNDFASYVQESVAKDEFVDIQYSKYEIIDVVFNQDGFKNFIIGGEKVRSTQTLTYKIFIKYIQNMINGEVETYRDIKPTYGYQEHHGNAIYYFEVLKMLKDYYENNKDVYRLDNTSLQNYILIIDEINRGNISKIFGELITLIEEPKRIGGTDELRVQLPYSSNEESNELFGIPKNLYIIGTMNTADRSIAVLDTALRRRFDFKEMMPDINLINEMVGTINEINISEMLKRINKRIEVLYDRDHMIGHAYFLDIKNFSDLKDVMKNKIIPLLQEYFYDDWQKINMVFNNNGFIEENTIDGSLFNKIDDSDFDDEQKVYTLNEDALTNVEKYKEI